MSKCKILFFAANPKDTTQLQLGEEVRGIDEAIQAAEFRDCFELEQAWATRPSDLAQNLLRYRPAIVHFSGHGSTAGEIILQGDDGTTRPVAPDALTSLFDELKDRVRLVVFNACYSATQAAAVADKVGCTVGTNKAVGDKAAIIFAASFYQALAFERSVESAFNLARTALKLEGVPEDATFELHVGAGVNASMLKFVTPPGGQAPPVVPAQPLVRENLIKDLAGLTQGDFGMLVALIPGAGRVVNFLLPVPIQATMLSAWAESSKGPGLETVARALANLP